MWDNQISKVLKNYALSFDRKKERKKENLKGKNQSMLVQCNRDLFLQCVKDVV